MFLGPPGLGFGRARAETKEDRESRIPKFAEFDEIRRIRRDPAEIRKIANPSRGTFRALCRALLEVWAGVLLRYNPRKCSQRGDRGCSLFAPACPNRNLYIYIYIHTHIYIHTYIHIHVHMYTYTYLCM